MNENKKKQKKPVSECNKMDYSRVPPQSKDLENAVLGAILMQPSTFDVINEILKPESFYVYAHQTIYKAIASLISKNQPADLLTLVEELKRGDQLEAIGGPYALMQLTKEVTSTANIVTHAKIIQEKFLQREVIRIAGEAIGEAYEDSSDVFELIERHEKAITHLTGSFNRGKTQRVSDSVMKVIERADMLMANPGVLTGVPTGFYPLDKITNGWQESDLIILAARPSVGKSFFAINLARNCVTNLIKQTNVAIFSLEMSATQVVQRLISCDGDIPLNRITKGNFQREEDYKHFTIVSNRVAAMNFYIDDTPAITISEFRSRARTLVNKNKVGLLIIDYLQLMSGATDGQVKNREGEISYISRSLKALAKELNVPIIALSQLSRAVEERKGGEPQLSDLRESGAIEQDADMVIFLTRPSYQQDSKKIDNDIANDLDVWIKKNRHGALDKLPMKIDLNIQKAFDLSQWKTYQDNKLSGQNLKPINFPKLDASLPFDTGFDNTTVF